MTQLQWQQLEATVAGMSDAEKQRLVALVSTNAIDKPRPSNDSIIGLFADESELIEQIIQETYRLRATSPFRTGE